MAAEWLADEPVIIATIAERVGMNPRTLNSRYHRSKVSGSGSFPRARGSLGERLPWWYWTADVVPWAAANGIPIPEPEESHG